MEISPRGEVRSRFLILQSMKNQPAELSMIISTDIQIPFSRSIVFATYRDRLMELIPYMTNVRNIEVRSRYQENACIHTVN